MRLFGRKNGTADLDASPDDMYARGYQYSNEANPPDLDAACSWFERAADAGHTDSMYQLGYLYAKSIDPPNIAAARHWLELDGPRRGTRRQRRHGVFLRAAATQRPGSATVVHPGGVAVGDRDLDRADLPPPPPAACPGQAHPDRTGSSRHSGRRCWSWPEIGRRAVLTPT